MVDTDGWNFYDANEEWQATSAAYLVGPVVGRVTDTTARVLVESSRDDTLILEVRSSPAGTIDLGITNFLNSVVLYERRVPISAARPLAVELSGLSADSIYAVAVTLEASKETRVARFKTTMDKADWKFAIVSCNSHKYMENTGHWQRLASCATSLDAIFHVGDQVYADDDIRRAITGNEGSDDGTLPVPEAEQSAWVRSKNLLKGVPQSSWGERRGAIMEFYRGIYRRTWNYPPTAAALAACANYMICDDHEICDDIGDLPTHSDPDSDSYLIACAAYDVYREYQAQLLKDNDFTKVEPAYACFKLSKRVGVFLTDNRIERSVRKPLQPNEADWKDKTFLGPSQWAHLEESLTGDCLADTDVLLFITPTPLIFLSHLATSAAIRVIDDAVGTWGNGEYDAEQQRLLTRLSDWQGEKASRGVCIFAGDIHVGGFSSAVMHKEGSILNQITSSAICNEPTTELNKFAAAIARGVMRFDTYLQGFRVLHRDWVFDPNWAMLDIEIAADGGPPHMTGSLFHVKGKPRIRNFKFGEPLTKSAKVAALEAAKHPDMAPTSAPPLGVRKEEPKARDKHANRAAEAAYATSTKFYTPPLKKSACGCTVS